MLAAAPPSRAAEPEPLPRFERFPDGPRLTTNHVDITIYAQGWDTYAITVNGETKQSGPLPADASLTVPVTLDDGYVRVCADVRKSSGSLIHASKCWGITVNGQPPEPPELLATPDRFSSQSSATFMFTNEEMHERADYLWFECSLDGSPFSTCSSPYQVQDLDDGQHTFRVRTGDSMWQEYSEAVTYSWTVDTTPPESPTFSRTPAEFSADPRPTFGFSSSDPGSDEPVGFECALDGAEFKPCDADTRLEDLPDGEHTLKVRATDKAGNTSEAAEYSWTVDTTPPEPPRLIVVPDERTASTWARFVFGVEEGARLECSLDGAGFEPCDAVLEIAGLALGQHTIEVRQTDKAGNTSQVTRFTWEVVAPPASPQPAAQPQVQLAGQGASNATLRATVASKTAQRNRQITVTCQSRGGKLRSCRATLYAAGKLIGRGNITTSRPGTKLTVPVTLNTLGRKLLGRALGGLQITLKALANIDGHKRRTQTKTTIYPERTYTLTIPFRRARADLDPTTLAKIRKISHEIRNAKQVTCEGHTDSRGHWTYNQQLALKRARAVCHALKANGLKAKTKTISHGESRPAHSNHTPTGRQANRRVTIHITYA